MTDTPIKLVTAPSLDDKIKVSIVEILTNVLIDAQAGKYASILLITERVDGHWGQENSGTLKFPETIGRLEICKTRMVNAYLEEHNE